MRQDVVHAASCGAHGVVLGMLTPGGAIDQDLLRPFADLCLALGGGDAEGLHGATAARCGSPHDLLHTCGCCPAGLDLTFHRAFDQVKDQRQALDDLVACRVRRVLSSGGCCPCCFTASLSDRLTAPLPHCSHLVHSLLPPGSAAVHAAVYAPALRALQGASNP